MVLIICTKPDGDSDIQGINKIRSLQDFRSSEFDWQGFPRIKLHQILVIWEENRRNVRQSTK